MMKCGVYFAVRTEFKYYSDELRLQMVEVKISNVLCGLERKFIIYGHYRIHAEVTIRKMDSVLQMKLI
jgi:hypothetical protein